MKKKLGYGLFLQDGGMVQQGLSVDEQLAGAPVSQQMGTAPAQGGEAQMMAEEFLNAFMQLPPEAQQIIMQTLMQGG